MDPEGGISSHQPGITSRELREAIPESLLSRTIHLHWIERTSSGDDRFTLTVKIEIDGQALLLKSLTEDIKLMEDWDVEDPAHHTNARLVALERVLTDPANEDKLLSL